MLWKYTTIDFVMYVCMDVYVGKRGTSVIEFHFRSSCHVISAVCLPDALPCSKFSRSSYIHTFIPLQGG